MPSNWKDLQARKMSAERIARVQAEVDATISAMDVSDPEVDALMDACLLDLWNDPEWKP